MNTITSIPSVLQSAKSTIQRSTNGVAQDVAVVANSSTPDSGQTLDALVDSHQQVLYTQAGAKLIKAADEMVSSLLDAHA